ncbi:DUF4919 domain-containing protein [Flavobacterium psychrotrophum]|uniref:DUF4919 domain-containing protein n=1 Tax=Flavobacterium psychrotrophum TaxID=2294119 RepID=UPI000E31615A|nr:DUF4919 domain-containing protein [Flavobacterium psychrotrophum]
MKKLLFMALLTITVSAAAQTQELSKPDYTGIEKNIKDKTSQYFYKKLFARFTTADSTLTLEERRHLYYGFSFTEKYSPYSSSPSGDELKKLLEKENLTNKEMQKVVLLAGRELDLYPFNIRMREYRQYFLKKLGKNADAALENSRIEIILDAILSTGDGTSKDNAFYVIEVGNEYQLLDILGFEYGGEQSLVEGRYDYLTLQKNAYNVEGFYFDVSRSLQSMRH